MSCRVCLICNFKLLYLHSISDLMVHQFRRLHNIRLNTKLTHFIETILICIYFCSCSKHDKKWILFYFAVIASGFLLREHIFAIFTSRFFLRGYYFAVFVSRFLLRGYCLRGYCFRDYHLEAFKSSFNFISRLCINVGVHYTCLADCGNEKPNPAIVWECQYG